MSEDLKRIEARHKKGRTPKPPRHRGVPWCPECEKEGHPCDVVKLARALNDLLTAVTFGPKSTLSPGNPGYEAKVPIGFVDSAENTLHEVAGEE